MSDIQANKKLRAIEFALVIFVALAPLIARDAQTLNFSEIQQ